MGMIQWGFSSVSSSTSCVIGVNRAGLRGLSFLKLVFPRIKLFIRLDEVFLTSSFNFSPPNPLVIIANIPNLF